MGEDSGDDSARVEWWRFVAALEKSSPLDRRGRTEAGDGYDEVESGFGDAGMRFDRFAVLVLEISRGGICKLRPRDTAAGLLGVTGPDGTLRSSLADGLLSSSSGEGERMDLKSYVDQGLRLVVAVSGRGFSSAVFETMGPSPLPFSFPWIT